MYSFDLIYVQTWIRPYIYSFDLIYVQVDLIYLTLDLIYQILTIYLKTDFCPIWRVIVLDVNQYWFCCDSKRLHCAGTLWICTGSRIVRSRSRIKIVCHIVEV